MNKIIFIIYIVLFIQPMYCQQINDKTAEEKTNINSIIFGGTVENLISESKLSLVDFKNSNPLLINVEINKMNYLFLYDTGAAITLVSNEIGLNETVKGKISLNDGYSKKNETTLITKDIFLNNICFKNIGCAVVDLETIRKKTCLQIDGIIGGNMINLCNWKINPIEESISFSNTPFTAPLNSKMIDIEFYSKSIPLINLSIEGKPFWVSLDTGLSDFFVLNQEYFFNLKKSKKTTITSGNGNYYTTINGVTEHKIFKGVIDTIYAGKEKLINVKTIIDIGKPSLGVKFFKNYITVFNFKDKKLFLTRIENPIPDESQFTLGFGLNGDNELIIKFLWDDEEVKKQRLKIGDKILSLNGINCENLDTSKYCSIMQELKMNNVLNLVVKRESKTFNVIVNKKI